jgi:hypothetical protein
MIAFQKSVEEHFGRVAQSFNSKLERHSSHLYGFLTKYALVIIRVHAGHLPTVCVNLRERRPDDTSVVDDETGMIGLGVLKWFRAPPYTPCEGIAAELSVEAHIKAQIEIFAANLSNYGQPFLNDPNADWAGARAWLDERIKIMHTPSEQKVKPGQPNDYIGSYNVHDAWITMNLLKLERWSPIFECNIPLQLKAVLDSANDNLYVDISFRGIPSEKGRYGRNGACIREVRILQI